MTKKFVGQRKSPQRAAGLKEEHQCGGTGSHTGHRYVDMLTLRSPRQHRQSTGVCEAAIKPGDFSVMAKSACFRSRWSEAARCSKVGRAKKKPAASCGRKEPRSQAENYTVLRRRARSTSPPRPDVSNPKTAHSPGSGTAPIPWEPPLPPPARAPTRKAPDENPLTV
ncbi:MAG: hypothetical protein RLZ42_335 [Armatimonadota bacterium]